MQVRGSGDGASGPAVTTIDSTTDEGAVTVVRAGAVEIALARVVGTPLGEGPHLGGTVAGGETTVLAVLRS